MDETSRIRTAQHLTVTVTVKCSDVIRATYELEPLSAAEVLATLESTGVPNGPEHVRPTVSMQDGHAVLEFPAANWGADVTMLVSALLAGEWADLATFERCRLVAMTWPDGLLPGPAFEAPETVLVGAIVKPSLGMTPSEHAETAAVLAEGGADLVKDDELLGNPPWCPLEDRVRAVVTAIPQEVTYVANVTGPIDSLLARARRAVELGAGGVMVNAFAQGLDSVRLLREAQLGVPVFAHRVGAAFWMRHPRIGVAPALVAELTRLCGADFVLVGSFTRKVADSPADVRAQVHGCHRQIGAARRSVAVLGGGVGPLNAARQVEEAGTRSGLMVLLGSAAYAYPPGPRQAVRATVEAVRT